MCICTYISVTIGISYWDSETLGPDESMGDDFIGGFIGGNYWDSYETLGR